MSDLNENRDNNNISAGNSGMGDQSGENPYSAGNSGAGSYTGGSYDNPGSGSGNYSAPGGNNGDYYGGGYNVPPNYGSQVNYTGYKKKSTGFGTASLVLGIISLIFFLMILNIPLAVLSIIFGIIQLAAYEKKGAAIAGIVTSSLSIIGCIVAWAMMIGTISSDPDFQNLYNGMTGNELFNYEYELLYEFPDEDIPDLDIEMPDLDTDFPQEEL